MKTTLTSQISLFVTVTFQTNFWLRQKSVKVCEDLQDILVRDTEHIKSSLIRGDFKECTKNSLLFLNSNLEREKPPKMQKPGAVHWATWMAQALYCQKMYL